MAKHHEYLQVAHTEGKMKSLLFGIMFSIQTFLVLAGTALAFWEGFRMYEVARYPALERYLPSF